MGEHYVRKRMEIIRNFMTQRLAHLIAIAKESTTMIAKVNVPSTISICTFVQLPLVTKKMKPDASIKKCKKPQMRNALRYVQLFSILFVELMEKLTATLVDWVLLIA